MKPKFLLISILFILTGQTLFGQITFPSPQYVTYGSTLSTANVTSTLPEPIVFVSYSPGITTVIAGGVHAAGVGKGIVIAYQYDPVTGALLASAGADIWVIAAPLTIQADNKSCNWGQPAPAFTASYTGWVNGDTGPASLSPADLPDMTSPYQQGELAKNYFIFNGPTGNTTGNYAPTYIGGTLTVLPIYPVPSAATLAAGNFTGTGATLNGLVNDNGAKTTVSILYTTVDSDGPQNEISAPLTTGPNPLPAGSGSTSYSAVLTGLATGTTYYYQVVASNPEFTTTGSLLSFTTAPSTNTNLANLQINRGTLTPAFATVTNNYTASVSNAVSKITVTPTTSDPTSTIKVNGVTVSSGTASGNISLSAGTTTTITIIITAQDKLTTQTYTITVTRAPSTNDNISSIALKNPSAALVAVAGPGFANYTASVSTSSVEVLPVTADPTAAVMVNGKAVTSGTVSNAIPLTLGLNTIITVVTAQDGVSAKTYIITVTREPSTNDNLSTIGLKAPYAALTPAAGPGFANYIASVSYATASIEVLPVTADPGATITVDGVSVTSGTNSGPIPLSVGNNTITTVVTAQDGVSTKTYIITVTRAVSNDDYLSSIALRAPFAPLVTVPGPGFANYTASVSNTTASIEVFPVTADPLATIMVNGAPVTSGTASAPIPLIVGVTSIYTVVTAADDISTKRYIITVTRAPSTNADLSSIGLRAPYAVLTAIAGPDYLDYTASVTNTTSFIDVLPVTANAAATIAVDGAAVTSGTNSNPIALVVGPNTITTVITAQDGITTKTCVITVTRAMAAVDAYGQLSATRPTGSIAIENESIMVHQGVSPNGDGINDFLQIDNIANYPENKLTIMNRNGQLIYEVRGYDNSSKVFDGHSNKNGQMQLPGTYFYQLDYMVKGISKHQTGFIVLKY